MTEDNQSPSDVNLDEINLGPGSGDNPSDTPSDELTTLRQQNAELEDRMLRVQAEAENMRRRMRKEMDDARKYQHLDFARGILPIVDNLTRAVQAAENSASLEQLLTGVKMVVRQFDDVLSQYQVKPIAAAGESFDPNVHEAISMVPSSDVTPMTVLQVVENGYQLHDRVLRPAKVIVSSGPPAEQS